MVVLITRATMQLTATAVDRPALMTMVTRSVAHTSTTMKANVDGKWRKRCASASGRGSKRHDTRQGDSSAWPRPAVKPAKQMMPIKLLRKVEIFSDRPPSQRKPMTSNSATRPGVAAASTSTASACKERRKRPCGTRVAVITSR